MKFDEFAEEIAKLEKWTKPLKDEQRELIYQEVKNIPSEAFHDIIQNTINSSSPNSPFPSIKRFKDGWTEWIREHPEKIWEYPQEECEYCNGRGYLEVWINYDSVKSQYQQGWNAKLYPCGYCNNWKNFFPRNRTLRPKKTYTWEDIEEILKNVEWRRLPPWAGKPKKSISPKPIPEMVDQIFRDVDIDDNEIPF